MLPPYQAGMQQHFHSHIRILFSFLPSASLMIGFRHHVLNFAFAFLVFFFFSGTEGNGGLVDDDHDDSFRFLSEIEHML